MLSSGFFDSYDGDRVYNADQFSSFLDGIIYDGVYQAVGEKFYVAAATDMMVTVGKGRAWFAHTWTFNNSLLKLALDYGDTVYSRIDLVVLEVNKNDRENHIKIIKGDPRANPVRPQLIKTDSVIQYALASINIPANATSISQSNITQLVDTAETPLVSALALSGIPSGGTIGQILAKKSSESGSVDWYDPDKLPYDKWYLADGISEANVLGAFKFINQTSEANALRSKNEGTERQLTKSSDSITWNSNSGFSIPAYTSLHNVAIWSSSPLSMIAKVSNVEKVGGVRATILSEMNNDRVLFLNTAYATGSFAYLSTGHIGLKSSGYGSTYTGLKSSSTEMSSGIIGVSFDSTPGLYKDGVSQSYSQPANITATIAHEQGRLIGTRNGPVSNPSWSEIENWGLNSFKIQYAVFYNAVLSAAQHAQIYRQIVSDSAS